MSSPPRTYRPLTPPMSSPVAPRRAPWQQGTSAPSESRPTRQFLSRYDEYMLSRNPDHKCTPEDILKWTLYEMGATDDTLWEYLDLHNKDWDAVLARSNGTLRTYGAKPQPDDSNVFFYSIPQSHFAIRVWPGGMEEYGQFCLDLFDVREQTAVNMPDDYKISYVTRPGSNAFGDLVSWEKAMHVENIIPGAEKYSVLEGSRLALIRPDKPPYLFEIPVRPSQEFNFAKPDRV